jgi:hypothetical protein
VLNRLVPPRPMTASNARITRTSPGALCIPSSSPSAFPVPDKVRSLRGKVTHRGEPCETYRGAQFPCWAGRMRTDLSVVTRRLSSLDLCRIHPLEVDSARLRSTKFLRIECKRSRSQRCCILDGDAKAPPGSAGRGVFTHPAFVLPSRQAGERSPLNARADRVGPGSARPWASCPCRLPGATACGRRSMSTGRGLSSPRWDRRCGHRGPWRRSRSDTAP